MLTAKNDRGGTNLPLLADDLALAGDSLPVLNAFREFLDQDDVF